MAKKKRAPRKKTKPRSRKAAKPSRAKTRKKKPAVRRRKRAARASSSPAYLQKLDPTLHLGSTRLKPSAAAESVAAARPASMKEIAVGVHSLVSQLSEAGTKRLLETDLVSVVIDCKAPPKVREKLHGWGGSCSGVSGSTIVARVPRAKLRSLARLSTVRYIEASTRLKLHSDLAHASSRLVRSGSRTVPQSGAGVLVGVVDTGIDVRHRAFLSGGKTRVVSYLDQLTDREFDSAQIDAGDAAGSTDTIGHGTHVAGIAAGNGAGSPGGSLRGVAPEADLAVVKSTLETADILAAIAHVFEIAGRRNQPVVVNCSFGGHVGGHDGSTLVERAIDELSGRGRILVVSAGNEGNDPIHAHTVLRGDGASPARWEARLSLNPRMLSGPSGPVELGILVLQVWQQREDGLRIRLRSPSGVLLEPPAEGTTEHDFGSFLVNASRQTHPYSGDPFVTFEILTLPQSQWLTGWTLVVEEEAAGTSVVGAVHAWIRDGAEGSFQTGATFGYQIGMPATAYSAITVGSYVTRNQWSSRDPANPTIRLDGLVLESLSSFSSRGPTRNGDAKPEVAAPGEWLLAPLSKDALLSELPLFTRAASIDYASLRGTSMAAPYVTGAIALLLEKDGGIDWAEAKRRLIQSTRQDRFSEVCWNPRWGYGKVDIERLLTVEPG